MTVYILSARGLELGWGLSDEQDGTSTFPQGPYDLVREKDDKASMRSKL